MDFSVFDVTTFDLSRFLIDGLGYCAIALSFISYQQKTQRKIAVFQAACNLFWMTHMFLLGAMSGGLLNLVALFRGILYSFREKHEFARKPYWQWIILFMIAAVTAFSIWYGDGPKALLPAAAMSITVFSLALEDPKKVRIFSSFSSPCWIAYSVFAGSIPSILAELVNLASILIGYLRLDRKKNS